MHNSPARDAAIQQVRSVIERLVRDGSVVAGADGKAHTLFPVAVSAGESQALRHWVVREGASQTIEIGLGYGVSALHICEALLRNRAPDARHVVIDPHQGWRFSNIGLQVLEEAGVSHLVEHHAEESQIALPHFLQQGRSFDLAFVDGSHFFERVFLDLFYLGHLVKPGRVLMLDDYQLPAIQRAVSFYVTNLGWTVEEEIEDEAEDTQGAKHRAVVLRTPVHAVERDFRDFVEF